MTMQEDHQFDRRIGDANVQALALRMTAMEGRVETLELSTKSNTEELGRATVKLGENTDLTREVHEAVFGVKDEFSGLAEMSRDMRAAMFGSEGKPGVADTVSSIYELVEAGKSLFNGAARVGRWIASCGRGVVAASDAISKAIRRFWWVIAVAAACITYLKTGKLPDIPLWPQ